MEIFILCLKQMLMMAFLIVLGYILRKKDIVPPNSYIVLSRLETYIFVPALNFYNQIQNCNIDTFKENYKLIFYGAAVVGAALLISYPLSRIFIKNPNKNSHRKYQRNVYKYALTFANYGFVGNFVILSVWGQEMLFKYSMFTFVPAVVSCAWGNYQLIPKEKGAGILKSLKKGLITPPLIALLAGMILGLLNLKEYIPDFIHSACGNAGNCMGPVAMVLAGVVIGGYRIKGLLRNWRIYLLTVFRLVIIPGIFILVLKAFNTPDLILTLTLVFLGSPIGMNTIVYPAAYGGETRTGASMTVISSAISIITIPIMYFLLIVL